MENTKQTQAIPLLGAEALGANELDDAVPEWVTAEPLWAVFRERPDLLMRVAGYEMEIEGLGKGSIVALSRATDASGQMAFPSGAIVAVRIGGRAELRRVRATDGERFELIAQTTSERHPTIGSEALGRDAEIIGVVIGSVRREGQQPRGLPPAWG